MAFSILFIKLMIIMMVLEATPITSQSKSYTNNNNEYIESLFDQLFTKFSTTEKNKYYNYDRTDNNNRMDYSFCRNGTDCFIFPNKNVRQQEYNAENLENILEKVFQSLSENAGEKRIRTLENIRKIETPQQQQYTICRNDADCYVLTPVRKTKQQQQQQYTKTLENIIYDLLETLKVEKKSHDNKDDERDIDDIDANDDDNNNGEREYLSNHHSIITPLKYENKPIITTSATSTIPTNISSYINNRRIENYSNPSNIQKKDNFEVIRGVGKLHERSIYNTNLPQYNKKRNSESFDELLGKVFQTTTNRNEPTISTTPIIINRDEQHECGINGKCVPLFSCKTQQNLVANVANCNQLEICCDIKNLIELDDNDNNNYKYK